MAKKSELNEGIDSPLSPSKKAEEFFNANPQYDSIIVTEDGIVFPNTIGGINAVNLYSDAQNPKINYQIFDRN